MAQTKAQLLGPVVGDVVMDVSTLSLDAEGNKVGIGTTGATATLHVFEPTEGDAVVQFNSGDNFPTVNRGLILKAATGPTGYTGSKWIFDAQSSGGRLEFQTVSTPRLTILEGGNIGINDQNPGDKLSISGGNLGIYHTGNNHGNVYFYKDGTAKGWVKYRGNDEKLVIGNVTDAINVLTNGNVGIGTNNPLGKLVVSNGSAGLEFNVNSGQAIVSYNRSTSAYTPVGMQGSTVGLYIGGLGQVLHINSSGKVGINKTNASSLLHVAGADYQTLRLENTDNGANGPYIEFFNNSDSPADNDYIGIISFKNNNSADEEITYSQIRAKSVDVTDGSEDGDLTFHTRHQGSFGERLKVSVDQGTGSLETKLDIIGGNINVGAVDELNGSLRFRSNDASVNNTDNVGAQISAVTEANNGAYVGMSFYTFQQGSRGLAEGLRLTNGGYVGINVTSPENPLHVKNTSNAATSIRIQTGTSSTNNGDEYSSVIFDGNGYVGAKIASHRDHGTWNDRGDLRFYSGYGNNEFTERLRITNTGELSISGSRSGNSVSDAILKFNILNSNGQDKKAEIKAIKTSDISSELIFSTTASHTFAERMRIADNGNIGINNNNPPAVKLAIHEGGSDCKILLSSSWSGTQQIIFGGGSTNSTGDSNSTAGKIVVQASAPGGAATGDMKFYTNPGDNITEQLRITYAGNVELKGGTMIMTGNSSYDEQMSINSYNTHSATGHRPRWSTFCKFIQTASSGTYLKIPFAYQGNFYTRTYIRIRGISAQYNSASHKGFLYEGAFGHLTGINSSQTFLIDGNISSMSTHNGSSTSDPPHIRLNFSSAYTGNTNQGVDIFLEWFTAIPLYSIMPDQVVLN